MLNLLRAQDAHLVELGCGAASVLLAPSLNGRIFCQLDGVLIHRLDVEALHHPSPTEYDNLGGNSLWPAPEGGPFAFNYVNGSDIWTVQEGISRAVPSIERSGDSCARIHKTISLTNRRGVTIQLGYERRVRVAQEEACPEGYDLRGLTYFTEDSFVPLGEYRTAEVLLAPWSLEQFPGAEGILAFGKVTGDNTVLNCDFYTDPGDRITWNRDQFTFHLGGKERHQIGVPTASDPMLIGALDPARGLLLLRRTEPMEGVYFNIADNEQAGGPFSAADLYSIFNGGELGFFELETIGAMAVSGDRVAASTLPSETTVLKGNPDELARYLREQEGVTVAL
jgi:hypothetical protein